MGLWLPCRMPGVPITFDANATGPPQREEGRGTWPRPSPSPHERAGFGYRGNIETRAAPVGPGNTWPSTLTNTLSSTEKYSVPLPALAYISTS